MSGGRRAAYRAGLWAETAAAWWLRLKGYRVLARRFRSPVGELDIVAERGDVLAVVEVKARRSLDQALQSVTPRQQERIRRACLAFVAQRPEYARHGIRFDVILYVPWRPLRHIMDAWRFD